MTPLIILGFAILALLVFGIIVYSISGIFFFPINPPFTEQAATYKFRDRIKQSFYEQER
jgi:hypothetical protein